MKNLKITTDTDANAKLLIQFLRELKFVLKIELDQAGEAKAVVSQPSADGVKFGNNVKEMQALLAKAKSLNLFSSIKDPTDWQKKIRDEWS